MKVINLILIVLVDRTMSKGEKNKFTIKRKRKLFTQYLKTIKPGKINTIIMILWT